MDTQRAVQSQFLASLKMLKEAIVKCPPSMWDARQDKDKFWYRAHHALYWAQVDLRATLAGFTPWNGRRKPDPAAPFSKEELLHYLSFLERQIAGRSPTSAASGPRRFRPEKLERAIGSIRHIQQHTGELYERLGTRANVQLRWYEKVRRITG